jgi:cytochrome P450
LWGNTVQFQPDPIGFMKRAAQEHGQVVKFRVLLDHWYLLTDPDHVYEVLVKNSAKYHKPRINKQLFRDFMGNGLVSSDGAHHARQHKMIKPGFHRRRIDGYCEIMVRYTQEMVAQWTAGETVDIGDELTTLTLKIIAKTMFGADISDSTDTIGKAMCTVNEVLVDYVNMPLPLPTWWPSKKNRRKWNAIRDVENILVNIVEERRKTGDDGGDLLSMMVFAEDEAGQKMSEKELRDEGMTLFFAGHETASHTMTWIWWLIAEHPPVLAKLQAELDTVLEGRAPTAGDLRQLPYLEMVIKEGLRLFGAAWTFMREPTEDVQLGEFRIPKGAYLVISPHILHRQPALFPDPERFDPERFSSQNAKGMHPGAYVPFSTGPRVCLGKSFAMTEMRLILATILQRVNPTLPPGFEPIQQAQISLHSANGMPNIVHFRESSGS